MATPVIMPKFGMSQEEGTIVEWLKREGDRVEAGEPILEVTTDKVNMDVEAPATGILRGITAKPDEIVPVTQTLAYVVAPDEPWASPESPQAFSASQPEAPGPAAAQGESEHPVRATPLARRVAAEHGVDLTEVQGLEPGGRIKRADVEQHLRKVRATPAARRVAREASLDLGSVSGSGPRGRVQEVDVRRRMDLGEAPGWRKPERGDASRLVPFAGTRAVIAQRMSQSYRTAPHIHLSISADVSAAQEARERWVERTGSKVSLTVLLCKVCAWALERHPAVNSTVDEAGVRIWESVNVGIAVALEEGLIVPVVRRANTKGIAQLAEEIGDLAQKAREGSLRAEEVTGGTFTLTNLGMFGIESFDPIINPPQCAILGVGVAMPTQVVRGGESAIRPMMQLTLAADHRALDGASAARFLRDLKAGIEDPALLLL